MISEHKVFYNVGSVERIPCGEGRTYHIDQTNIAIFRTRDGALYATQAECPHKGGPLADGFVGPGTVICPLHSFKFSLTNGQPVENPCQCLKIYTVQVSENGEILLGL